MRHFHSRLQSAKIQLQFVLLMLVVRHSSHINKHRTSHDVTPRMTSRRDYANNRRRCTWRGTWRRSWATTSFTLSAGLAASIIEKIKKVKHFNWWSVGKQFIAQKERSEKRYALILFYLCISKALRKCEARPRCPPRSRISVHETISRDHVLRAIFRLVVRLQIFLQNSRNALRQRPQKVKKMVLISQCILNDITVLIPWRWFGYCWCCVIEKISKYIRTKFGWKLMFIKKNTGDSCELWHYHGVEVDDS